MNRHFSDTAYIPQISSRLNPNINLNPNLNLNPNIITRPSRGLPVGTVQQRGTMAMPTSPIMKKMVVQAGNGDVEGASQNIWDSPQTAQAFFSFQQQQQQNNAHQQQPQVSDQAFDNQVSPMDFTPSSSGFYDSTARPPTTSSLQYISPQSAQFPNEAASPGQFNTPMDMDQIMMSPTIHTASLAPAGKRPNDDDIGNDHDHDDTDMDNAPGAGPGGRKKRIQVRIACTHCQKACKKCSNTRPCERCVKYGLTDCIDSTRKPRKTGVKRGPYKRRSSKYTATGVPYPPSSDGGNSGTNKNNRFSNSVTPAPIASQASGSIQFAKTNHTRAKFPHLPHHIHAQTDHKNLLPPLPQKLLSTGTTGDGLIHHPPSSTHAQSITYPPFPKPTSTITNPSSNLVAAISNALSLPQQSQWIDGQRLPLNPSAEAVDKEQGPGKTSPLYPKTPVGSFPYSLVGGRDDPFSRAVSPIKQFEFDFGNDSTNAGSEGNISRARNGLSGVREESEGVEDASRAEQRQRNAIDTSSTSVPSTLNQSQLSKNTQVGGSACTTTQRSLSNLSNPSHLRINTSQIQSQQIQSPVPTAGTGAYTPFLAPTKIRKPSLRTLMSTTSSRAPSPTIQVGQGEMQSPTLFTADDGGMILDDMEVWNTWSGNNKDMVVGDEKDGHVDMDTGDTSLFD
ncbi:hypothetical protein I302_100016 [Kwoniella bestiolae CBS 10118]|uniref:Zn(2)-C6 fungal-type domain-containing protein n=1 Tax=Kwoniella bestiolae CBS 10118 TaxID=1296100 RepID=A0A1B9G3V8_9TREE|nr:hypothetical protein I302_03388 [Kwoniella bestiolae CBS 10118]OCF25715.1 hypothetical protein I302_03388 [Kwoniella bestiolae CBS 10118]